MSIDRAGCDGSDRSASVEVHKLVAVIQYHCSERHIKEEELSSLWDRMHAGRVKKRRYDEMHVSTSHPLVDTVQSEPRCSRPICNDDAVVEPVRALVQLPDRSA